jgi:hypothetical protein
MKPVIYWKSVKNLLSVIFLILAAEFSYNVIEATRLFSPGKFVPLIAAGLMLAYVFIALVLYSIEHRAGLWMVYLYSIYLCFTGFMGLAVIASLGVEALMAGLSVTGIFFAMISIIWSVTGPMLFLSSRRSKPVFYETPLKLPKGMKMPKVQKK